MTTTTIDMPPIPKTTYISWLDSIFLHHSTVTLLSRQLGILTIWYLIATLPLWLSGQSALMNHFIWPLGASGIFVAIFLYGMLRPRMNDHIANIDMIIADSDKAEFRRNLQAALDRLSPQKRSILLSLVAICAFFVLISLSWQWTDRFVIFSFMGTEWYAKSDNLFPRILTLTLAVIPVFFLLVTGFHLIQGLLRVVRIVYRTTLIPSPRTCQRKFLPTLKFLLLISFLFSSFAGFFMILFQDQLWPLTRQALLYWGVIGMIIGAGMLGVIFPTYVVRHKIFQIKEARLDAITEQVLNLTKENDCKGINMILELYRLEEQLELNNKVESIFMGWRYLSSFVLSILFPLVIAVAQIYLQNYMVSQ
ncbi:MAG: hypothetical protein AB2689_08755 [Candidatus Thiodiazotropha taylori]